jgi:ADP-ribosyl-[dinitrogen reductase] hydrolase
MYKLHNASIGFALGDAYGLPFRSFKKYQAHLYNQMQEMISLEGSNLPAGTWGWNTSLMLATMDFFAKNGNAIDAEKMMLDNQFLESLRQTYMGLIKEERWIENMGYKGLVDNNAFFPRLLPVAFLLKNQPAETVYENVKRVTSISHKNTFSYICAFIYTQLVIRVLNRFSFENAYEQACQLTKHLKEIQYLSDTDFEKLQRILNLDLKIITIADIYGDKDMIHTLEAVIWTVLHSSSYSSSVHLAISIGGETDTIASLVGGLAGLLNTESFPEDWVGKIKNKDMLLTIPADFSNTYKDCLGNIKEI